MPFYQIQSVLHSLMPFYHIQSIRFVLILGTFLVNYYFNCWLLSVLWTLRGKIINLIYYFDYRIGIICNLVSIIKFEVNLSFCVYVCWSLIYPRLSLNSGYFVLACWGMTRQSEYVFTLLPCLRTARATRVKSCLKKKKNSFLNQL